MICKIGWAQWSLSCFEFKFRFKFDDTRPKPHNIKSRNFIFRAYIWCHLPHFPWKFKSWAGKLLKMWGSNPRSGKSKHFCPFFFSFSNFFTQNWVSLILTWILAGSSSCYQKSQNLLTLNFSLSLTYYSMLVRRC